ncbi:daptide biosynthesis RiPP recognition protein [Lentzea sp. NBRC 102530]|uniref:daptide biosynthesis RiPP recognition protein n=1 Tax=Lentzea sp. NBRC 102530 TaxID=3032201 RepID=UPI0024A06BEE|nr:daptide biosynthesis RiPP recognition protein [Lentzea sp. NBRC 102530]GLY50316.1 hypothetical protein Lesp01_39720 [Lentzea sp. NBRC 102530]
MSTNERLLAALVRLTSGNSQVNTTAGRVVFVESAEHADFALGLGDCPEDVVFTPEQFEGGISEPGDELFAGDGLFVYTQDYLSTPFLAVAGPTIVRMTGQEDHRAFLEDADLARSRGEFVEQLLNPSVFLADQCALGSTHLCGAPALLRLHIRASGEVCTSPGGSVLGTVESTVDELEAAAEVRAGDVCLNGVVDASDVDAARAERPWLSRYLRTLDVLRGLRAQGRAGYRVSGFGGRLVGTLPALDEPADAPLLLWNDSEHLLCDTATGRLFRLGADAARLTELLLVTGSGDEALVLAREHLDLADAVVADALGVVARHFEQAA